MGTAEQPTNRGCDPARPAHDIAERKLSTEYVRREYGVAVKPESR